MLADDSFQDRGRAVDVEEMEEIVSKMRRQESTTYRCEDYLARGPANTVGAVDEAWRQRMCEWMYVVVDHCNFNRNIVMISAKYLDICLTKGDKVIRTRRNFQLAAMTSLHLAMKIIDTSCVKVDSLVQLSRGLFTTEDVIKMEEHLIITMGWHLHPPSPTCFLTRYMDLFHSSVSHKVKFMIAEVSRFIAEMSVCVYKFVKYKSSVIAYASLLISMDSIDENSFPLWQRLHFYRRMASVVKLWNTSKEVSFVSMQLRKLVEKNADLKVLMETIDPKCCILQPTPCKTSSDGSSNSPRNIVKGPAVVYADY
mmetsp:Transcript_31814/g.48796  ORF Transcript_31814/g.48796 Transcript_31814/m.48796 type:complete len:311 (+) Transcript_31814:109-1041(+)|eukprot:CAMPEP_0195291470 /NCGR_PEP_ID=MMETSP0707-20130614/7813_1 /TAXON_ID=33640 /ORGANISM="Asterionellopsis glacialis, Strain CCMP134" /LENGTH=310 /DNA_ID=CAMNT_0040351787 /DNA_START=60 /DNA_END=992 /DNA_ORIENTATION=+